LLVITGTVALAPSCTASISHAEAQKDAPQQTVIIRNLDKAGGMEVENRGPEISLSLRLVVQQMNQGTWHDSATDLLLSETCVWNPQPGCQTLPHGAKLRPVPWNGMSCSGQCPQGCRATIYLGPGLFRFTVTTCDHKQRFFGPAFTMPDYDHSELKKRQEPR
jgi:hypothetical protein